MHINDLYAYIIDQIDTFKLDIQGVIWQIYNFLKIIFLKSISIYVEVTI